MIYLIKVILPWLIIFLIAIEGAGNWSSSLVELMFFVNGAWNSRHGEKLEKGKGQGLIGLAYSGTY